MQLPLYLLVNGSVCQSLYCRCRRRMVVAIIMESKHPVENYINYVNGILRDIDDSSLPSDDKCALLTNLQLTLYSMINDPTVSEIYGEQCYVLSYIIDCILSFINDDDN